MLDAPRFHGSLPTRAALLVAGLFLFAGGIVLIYESRLGLSPWDVLNQGVAKHSPLSFGTANIAVALLVIVAAQRLGARIGPGTIANAVLIGAFVDLLLRVGAIEDLADSPLAVRAALLVGGIAVIGFGSGLYLWADLGAGPRDSLMLALSRRMRTRVGVVRTAIEASATIAGFAMGGTVGVGTVAFAVGIGPAVELSFVLLARSPFTRLEVEEAPAVGT